MWNNRDNLNSSKKINRFSDEFGWKTHCLFSLFSLFLEILNDCSDVDEIKFQEDGTWCPMRPKKESVKVPTQSIPKIESEYVIL